MFCKLYERDGKQVLVMLQGADDGPEVRVFCKPDGLGVCSLALSWSDDDDGWTKAERAFANVDEEWAMNAASRVYRDVGKFTE